ncbi:uncharacterized protein EDB91DRAFT_1051073, partial [Suillus paluster]|uniref:uncharacterized protein n=1 Tax=Suillus paluster TaxID=48578 RepID=UPI001B87433A
RFCHGQSNAEISELLEGLKTRCEALDVPPPEVFVADNCCHVRNAVSVVFPDATMKLDVWHFIMRRVHLYLHLIVYKLILRARYATVILNPSKNPHRKEVVVEISACILKKHAEGGNPAKYWDRNEQETRLTSTFDKWACEGTVWSVGARKVHEEQLKHVQKGCLERQRQDIRTDGSRVEGSHKGWNSLQRVHTSGIVTFTGLCHDFVLRRNIRVSFLRARKSDFVASTHGSHHIHLIDRIAKQFNNLRLEEKTTSTCCLPELIQTTSEEHFGLVKSSFASTFGGLLDALSGEGNDAVDLALQSARSEILEELNIDPQLLSQPQAPFDAQLSLTTTIPTVAEVTDTSEANSHLAVMTANTQPQPTTKRKADDNEPEDSGQARPAACRPPRKIMRHMTAAASVNVPEVAASQVSTLFLSHFPPSTPIIPSSDPHLQGISPSITLDHFLKPRSRLPYCKAPSQWPTDAGASTQPPGMTRSQHFFTIATRIDACAMHISGDVEFHLFMDMRAEFAWISFKMTPKQWAAATETYNNHLEEKNHANGSETVKKNPQALLRKLGEIEVAVMNRVAKNDFKSHSGSESFWRRHCHAIELIKAEPGLGKKIRKAHTCSRCKTIMYPGPENSGYNHRQGFCADGAKQVSKTEAPPPWPQPPGIFSEGKRFHPRAFLETVKSIYEQVFLWPSGESPALEQEAFAMMLLDWSTTLEESGTVLFKLYEELEIDESTPDALLTVHNGIKHLRVEYLQEHWDSVVIFLNLSIQMLSLWFLYHY